MGSRSLPSTIATTRLVDDGAEEIPLIFSLKSYLTSSTFVLRIGN